ncbi:energy-coupling factor transporter transmembrane component T family protein [Dialister pneumosintes]|jgi:ABC-type cobalt transport system, permease component CbiQ and related transporters|uniref:Cobalt transporter n=1 Tax=Dialister pneumosintes TaxID=39950 RepID=A0A1B3WDM6_9FIRM|nr:energy-coupling factor transporter transmembrane component T [Dialister pneumosintes]AOH39068.1 cobalt transporter [Dialister pneumosintes]MBS6480440.1 energy-coupling factor transporter transmembrane protein EcfT [Dialister sp.]
MRDLVPITKIMLTVSVAVWAITLHTPIALLILLLFDILILLISKEFFKNIKAIVLIFIFSILLGVVEYIGDGSLEAGYVSALRMVDMSTIFIYLLGTVRLQHLTAAMVEQLKIPYEYAFMFTAGLRFLPDFIEENRIISEAQACRGVEVKGSFIKKCKHYMAIVRPLMLRSLGRSEIMALSLELRGFGSKDRTFVDNVSPHGLDYIMMTFIVVATISIVYLRIYLGY